jgi:hypothetical protein
MQRTGCFVIFRGSRDGGHRDWGCEEQREDERGACEDEGALNGDIEPDRATCATGRTRATRRAWGAAGHAGSGSGGRQVFA